MKYKRIFLITIDCLRASAVHCMGGKTNTKTIDKLANEGVLFLNAIANGPGTPESFPSIFTSTYPLMHKRIILSSKYKTLAEVLSKNGFVCAGFHSNPFLSSFFGWNRGFETYKDFYENISCQTKIFQELPQPIKIFFSKIISKIETNNHYKKSFNWIFQIYNKINQNLPYILGEELNYHVLKWLKNQKAKKIFLWLHYMDPHKPYIFTNKWLKRYQNKNKQDKTKLFYNLEVEYVDYCLGELIDSLEDLNFLDDSILILTADHGEFLGEHGLFGHSYYLYEELIHIPLIINGLEIRKKEESPVGLIDLPPTLLSLLKITRPKTFYGKNLIPVIKGETERSGVISETAQFNLSNYVYDYDKSVYSYRGKRWKLIIDNINEKIELYDLMKDPGEKNNLCNDEKDIMKDLSERLIYHISWERKIRLI